MEKKPRLIDQLFVLNADEHSAMGRAVHTPNHGAQPSRLTDQLFMSTAHDYSAMDRAEYISNNGPPGHPNKPGKNNCLYDTLYEINSGVICHQVSLLLA